MNTKEHIDCKHQDTIPGYARKGLMYMNTAGSYDAAVGWTSFSSSGSFTKVTSFSILATSDSRVLFFS